tara:strand:+ start:2799 stop:3317 length:519 start_codon:yes stop_codon:yes gene_type:complete
MKVFLVAILGFLLLVGYQNCADVNQGMIDGAQSQDIAKNKKDGASSDDLVSCMAIAIPYIELSFDFASSQQTAGNLPQNLELEINGETVYSDCDEMPRGYVHVRRDGEVLNVRQELVDQDPYVNMDIRLLSRPSCDSSSATELFSINERPNYQSHRVCSTTAVHAEITYLVN